MYIKYRCSPQEKKNYERGEHWKWRRKGYRFIFNSSLSIYHFDQIHYMVPYLILVFRLCCDQNSIQSVILLKFWITILFKGVWILRFNLVLIKFIFGDGVIWKHVLLTRTNFWVQTLHLIHQFLTDQNLFSSYFQSLFIIAILQLLVSGGK